MGPTRLGLRESSPIARRSPISVTSTCSRPHRGRGLGKWLIETVMAHPDLQGLRRFQLVTRDAHGLYSRHGFDAPAQPDRQMEIFRHGMYLDKE